MMIHFNVGWAKRSVPTNGLLMSQLWWARRFAPLPTLQFFYIVMRD
jgi:hypothetical protein